MLATEESRSTAKICEAKSSLTLTLENQTEKQILPVKFTHDVNFNKS